MRIKLSKEKIFPFGNEVYFTKRNQRKYVE